MKPLMGINKSIWITWENQRRNREISSALGIKLFELSEIDKIKNYLKKYLSGTIKTLIILIQERPSLVVCQNPSIVLSFLLILIKSFTNIKVCVDAHNAGLFPSEGKSRILNFLSKYIQRKADLTIVTNEALKQYVEMNSGRGFVLQDKIPNISLKTHRPLKGVFNILFICSFANDEPYQTVFKVAADLDPSICIYVTGDYRKNSINPNDLPPNVILTGFLPERDYQEMLNSVDATIDLTTRENCLVCGAYESIAVEKPMILSNTKALREYFNVGAVYTDNTCESLANAISKVVQRKDELITQIKELKIVMEEKWQRKKEELERILFTR